MLIEEPFDSSTNKITYYEPKPGNAPFQILLINGKQYFSTDGPMPKRQIKEISLEVNGVKKSLAPTSYDDLFEAQFSERSTTVILLKDGRVIVYFGGSDGAGGYYAIFIVKDGIVEQRFAQLGF